MPLSLSEINDLFLGYDANAEDVVRLMQSANLSSDQVVRLVGDAGSDNYLEYDVVAANTICENQGPQNSCGGNSLATDLEWIYNWATGTYVQLSRQCAYIWGQGTPRGDNGMTIEGGVEVAANKGVPPETLWQYPNPVRYMTKPPEGVTQQQLLEAARPFIVGGRSWCDRYDAGDAHLAGGQGVLYLGIPWRASMAQGEAVIEEFAGGYRGWHAVGVLARSPRKDRKGRRYWWLVNSHGARWGRRGLAEVSPTCVEGWFRDGGRVCGLSDLKTPVIRQWDYKAKPVTH